MTTKTLPSRDELKAQARRLRSALSDKGTQMPHATALETVARQWGYRDWNTLGASVDNTPPPRWQVGQFVQGHYLGHAFTARLKAVHQKGPNHAQLTLVFDEPIDVVASEKFSALRRQVTATVNAQGRTVEKTSDGQAHLVLS